MSVYFYLNSNNCLVNPTIAPVYAYGAYLQVLHSNRCSSFVVLLYVFPVLNGHLMRGRKKDLALALSQLLFICYGYFFQNYSGMYDSVIYVFTYTVINVYISCFGFYCVEIFVYGQP